LDDIYQKNQVDNSDNINSQSDRRTIARQHTAKMLKMLRGYGPKELLPPVEPQTAVVTELTSARLPSGNGDIEPLAAAEFAPTTVAEARVSYVRLVEESPDRRPFSPVAPAVPPLHTAKRSSSRHTVASLGEGLQQQPGLLGRLIAQTSELAQSSRIFQAYLPPHLRDHAVLIRMDEEAWTVQTDSASWATRLRYKLYDIRQALGRQLGVMLPKPHIRVEPVTAPPPLRRPPLALTHKNAQLIEQTAHDESDPRLSAALHRLAQHTTPDDP
jgi:hypothetical protein